VAIKRVFLQGVPREELDAIEMEIKLLQGLMHPNIVQYRDAIRSERHLNIVLEFVENGSLSSLIGKFKGEIPETLVAHYIGQVLLGLGYLHNQGVVHRDIKGANILSTKEGLVKLADFGVATKLNESRKSDSVVGTPYWMAPEIIEMTGQQSPACDIWSVGCTVIELLTGKPPYFDLQQMAALFRIVQDDHPPLPESISAACKDFLLECFQKDPNRRIDAVGLLKHPWVKETLKHHEPAEATSAALDKAAAPAPAPSVLVPGDDASEGDWDDFDDHNLPLVSPGARASASPRAGGAGLGQWAEAEDGDGDVDWDDLEVHTVRKPGKAATQGAEAPVAAAGGPLADSYAALLAYRESEGLDDLGGDDLDLGDEVEGALARRAEGDDGVLELRVGELELEEDPFDNIEFSDEPDVRSSRLAECSRLLALLTASTPEAALLDACARLSTLVAEHGSELGDAVTSRGVIPIVEVLESAGTTVLVAVLRLVNLMVPDNDKLQQNLALVGVIPAVLRFSGPEYPHAVRHQAATFIRHLCSTSDSSRKMFVSCGGVPALVGFLYEDLASNRLLLLNAVDCIRHIFDISSSSRKDFGHLFCKFGLITPLAHTLLALQAAAMGISAADLQQGTPRARPELAEPGLDAYVVKIAALLEMLANGDPQVKQHFTRGHVLQILIALVPSLPQAALILVLKAIRHLSVDPAVLEVLDRAGAIPTLVPFLSSPHQENVTQVLLVMYYMCSVYPARQNQAAGAGIVPHLARFIRTKDVLKEFAFPILFPMAKNGPSRGYLRQHDCLSLLLDVLKDQNWRTHALDALREWLAGDGVRVEFVLASKTNLRKLVQTLTSAQSATEFETVIGIVRRMLSARSIAVGLGEDDEVVRELLTRLQSTAYNNNVRINILQMLRLLMLTSDKSMAKFVAHPLFGPLLRGLECSEEYPFLSRLAAQILDDAQITTGRRQSANASA
jgi:hypothetical protein